MGLCCSSENAAGPPAIIAVVHAAIPASTSMASASLRLRLRTRLMFELTFRRRLRLRLRRRLRLRLRLGGGVVGTNRRSLVPQPLGRPAS